MAEIRREIDSLMKKVDALNLRLSSNTTRPMPIQVCSLCGSPVHSAQMCPSFIGYSSGIHEQTYDVNDYSQPLNNPYTETYTQGWYNHSNFAWQPYQPMNYLGGQPTSLSCQYTPSYQTHMQAFPPQQPFAPPVVEQQQSSYLEDSLKSFIQTTGQNVQFDKSLSLEDTLNQAIKDMQQISAELKTQNGQLATRFAENQEVEDTVINEVSSSYEQIQMSDTVEESQEDEFICQLEPNDLEWEDSVVKDNGSSYEQVYEFTTSQSGNQDDNFLLKEDVNFSDISLENFLNTLGPNNDSVSNEASVFLDSLLDTDSSEWEKKINNFVSNESSDVAKSENSMVLDPKSLHDTELPLMSDAKFLEDGRGMLGLKDGEWEAEVNNFLCLKLVSDKDEALDQSIPFDPGIYELRSSDSTFLKVPHAVDSMLLCIKLFEVIHPISSDLEPDIGHRSFEVSGWFNKHIHVVIIISADLEPDLYISQLN